ncbi:hypothetical protein SAMN05519104_5386 [Rhizobiales bacterium GAS188]|nr:hypothetical protein SAMN05519104_5386 [Rhizobiales bacterium GAS188]
MGQDRKDRIAHDADKEQTKLLEGRGKAVGSGKKHAAGKDEPDEVASTEQNADRQVETPIGAMRDDDRRS